MAFGDSLTAGFRLNKTNAYPAIFQKLMIDQGYKVDVINAGVSGDTSAQALKRVDWVLKSQEFDWAIVCIGANDGLRNQSLQAMESNLLQIVEKFQNRNVKVLLFGMKLPVNLDAEYRKNFEKVFSRVASKKKTSFYPFLLDGVAGNPDLQLDDQIHPNEEGQKRVAEHVKKVFIGALKSK